MLVITFITVVFYAVGVTLIFYYLSGVIPFLGACNLLDIISRNNLNDPFVSTYYLLWTLFFYLPESFLVLFIILCYFYMGYNDVNKLLVWVFLLNNTYLTELLDFTPLNYFLVSTTSVDTNSNTLLLNPLNRYHPFIFYLSVVVMMYIASVLLLSGSYWLSQFAINSVSYATEHRVLLVIILNWSALWLGSWWAFQEGTWGGWWNSDISEMLGLMIILIGFVYLHAKVLHLRTRSISLFLYSCLSGFLCTYYFIQINYELTSHNFGSRFFFFFNNNLLLFELVTLLSTVSISTLLYSTYIYTCDEYINPSSGSKGINFRKIFFNFKAYLLIFFCVWLAISLLPLIDLFTQKHIHITDLFLSNIYTFISFVFVLSTLYMFFEVSANYLQNQLFVLPLTHIFSSVLGASHYYKWTSGRVIHSLLVCFLLTNVQNADLVFLYWGHSTMYSSFYFTGNMYFFHPTAFICDVNSFSLVNISFDCDNFINCSWTQSSALNAYDVDQFCLSHSANILFNYFYFIRDWVKIFIIIESSDINVLSLVSVLTAIALFSSNLKPRFNNKQPRVSY